MRQNPDLGLKKFIEDLRKDTNDIRFKAIVAISAFLVCIIGFILFGSLASAQSKEGVELGKVADRDINAEVDIDYIDEKATQLRVEAEKKLVPAIFTIDSSVASSAFSNLDAFVTAFALARENSLSPSDLSLRLTSMWPDLAHKGLSRALAEDEYIESVFAFTRQIMEAAFSEGVFAIPELGLENYNPGLVETRKTGSGPLVYEQMPFSELVSSTNLEDSLFMLASRLGLEQGSTNMAVELALLFVKENAFFDQALSENRLQEVAARVEPVIRHIRQGERIIRKGFIVSPDDMEKFNALHAGGSNLSLLRLFAGIVLLACLFWGSFFLLSLSGWKEENKSEERSAFLFLYILALIFFLLGSALDLFLPALRESFSPSVIPIAFVAILVSMLYSRRFAVFYTLLLSMSLLFATKMDVFAMVEILASGIIAVILSGKAEQRIDLLRAGAILAVIQSGISFFMAVFTGLGILAAFGNGMWAALNGFFCSVLALGFLPLLEQWLNAATLFRLQELSDLNSPALKRLLASAPGTYSHSIAVAHLAETACRAIGADPLLARVGAYYHDIGKIEQPEYFIENQTGYNKHDEINPRLSATVLRSHVKFGTERAESLRLPRAVKAIIAEHHGNSIMDYFYDKALKEDDKAKTEEYRYPGPLPGSRESAVVMLADTIEAASRTVQQPTRSRLEQFVNEKVSRKFSSGQLEHSDLTFRDLETIKSSFVRILAGHYHARIEYPDQKEKSQ